MSSLMCWEGGGAVRATYSSTENLPSLSVSYSAQSLPRRSAPNRSPPLGVEAAPGLGWLIFVMKEAFVLSECPPAFLPQSSHFNHGENLRISPIAIPIRRYTTTTEIAVRVHELLELTWPRKTFLFGHLFFNITRVHFICGLFSQG